MATWARGIFLAPSCAILIAASTPNASADPTIAALQRPTSVTASAGHVIWSDYDSSSGRYYLTDYRGGKTERLPVAPRAIPFDVDLGTAAGSRLLATYSRCERESRQLDGAGVLPNYALGVGCDLYAFDFQSFRERKLRFVGSKHASEYLPTVSSQEPIVATSLIAFGRTYDSRRGKQGHLPYLYVQDLEGDRRPRRLPGGPRGRTGGPGPSRLDLHRQRLAFEWTYLADTSTGASRLFQIRLVSTTGYTRRVVDEGGYSGGALNASFLLSPTLGGGAIHWLFGNDGESGNFGAFFRYVISTRKCFKSTERLEPGAISSALDGGFAYYVQAVPMGYEVRQAGAPTTFEPARCGPIPVRTSSRL